MYVYISSNQGFGNYLYIVGHYTLDGDFHIESEYVTKKEAAERVHYLNGGKENG